MAAERRSPARNERAYAVAVVGGGPRGLAAIEALASRVPASRPIRLTVFEPHAVPGAGPHHDPGQPPLDRLNIPLRAIDIPQADYKGAAIGSFAQWSARSVPEYGPDDYPPRAVLGRFLGGRWRDLVAGPHEGMRIDVVAAAVVGARRRDGGWILATEGANHGPFDDVLLSPGHQPAEPDDQLRRWRDHAASTGAALMPAYPAGALLEAAAGWCSASVAIRGLGLSMIDVVRLLTVGLGGDFEAGPGPGVDSGADGLRYRPSGREPARILPFSLNGIPPAPKPATAAQDAAYDLGDADGAGFEAGLVAAMARGPDPAMDFACDTLARIAGGVLGRFGVADGANLAERWLEVERDPDAEHPLEERPPAEVLADHLAVAHGRSAPSVGYVIGQVWRKLQTPLRRAYNPSEVSPSVATSLVRFDEGLKRFSYGPPAVACAELLALIRHGLLDMRAVDDPDILMVDGGWRLSAEEGEATAGVMIDAVLASPDLAECSAPLISGLRDSGCLVPVGEKLGARTRPDGTVLDTAGAPVPGLALIGRLALGSVIATDSVHDCFGAAVGRWADAVRDRVG